MRGILFDLDGTLLDIELSEFLGRYFTGLRDAAGDRFPGLDLIAEVSASTEAMMLPHPELTNRDAFYADFRERTGIDLHEHWPLFERFYAERFPLLDGGATGAKGARRAVETALRLGMRVAIATNPIFPLEAVRHRLAWAGLGDLPVHLITTYEQMHATKPLPAYFRETAAMLGVEPRECLMVGDDVLLDLPAADVGMRTYYVGTCVGVSADYLGDLDQLADLLPRLVEA